MSEAADKKAIEACEGILAILAATRRQLLHLAHTRMSFDQLLDLEQGLRVGGSPERAEVQRMRLLLDARLDLMSQLHGVTAAIPHRFPFRYGSPEALADALTAEDGPATPSAEELSAPDPGKANASEQPEVEVEAPQPPEASEPPVLALGEANEAESVETGGLSVEAQPADEPDGPEAPATRPPVPTLAELVDLEDPGRVHALMTAGAIAVRGGDVEEAEALYSEVLDFSPDLCVAWLARGHCRLVRAKFNAAISDFRKAEGLAPGSPEPLVAMGDFFVARKDYERALSRFDAAIALDGNHAMARCRRGITHYHQHNHRQAYLDLQRALKLDPEIPNIAELVDLAIQRLDDPPNGSAPTA